MPDLADTILEVKRSRHLFATFIPVLQQYCRTGSKGDLHKRKETGCLSTNVLRMLRAVCSIPCEGKQSYRRHIRAEWAMPTLIPRGPLGVWLINYRPLWKHQASEENKLFVLITLDPALKQAMGNEKAPPESEKEERTLHYAALQTLICLAWQRTV